MKTQFAENLSVWDRVHYPNASGIVTKIVEEDRYPVKVRFTTEDGAPPRVHSYDWEGVFYAGRAATLKPFDYKLKFKRIKSKQYIFTKDELVLVRDSDDKLWDVARFVGTDLQFSPKPRTAYVALAVGCAYQHTWVQCIPLKGNEHLILTNSPS